MEHFIFNKVGDNIISAGFSINSILMKKGLPPILTFDKKNVNDESSSDEDDQDEPVFKSFKHLAVPISLLSAPNKNMFEYEYKQERDIAPHTQISDDIYDKLLKLVEYDNWKKNKSKKVRTNPKSKHANKSSTYKRNRTK